MKPIILDGNSLSIADVYSVASRGTPVKLGAASAKKVEASQQLVEQWVASNEVIYGVTTGFGAFANVRVSNRDIEELQRNLILSHSAGAGEPLPPQVVRGMLLLRINALAKGYSGVRLKTLQFLTDFLNAGIIPIIPMQGSVGSSGDLVQLSHLVLTMMGKGKVLYRGDIMDAGLALRRARLAPLHLMAKEGLALVNGTQMMTAYVSLAVYEAKKLAKMADVASALSVEALKGTDTAFDERIHKLRPHPGQIATARNLRRLLAGSEIRESHRYNDPRVQDAYSIRCIPQVHGASRDTIEYAEKVVTTEINSATDNPLIFPEEKLHLEGGNFHGQPIALAADFLAIALSEFANITERRIERLVNGSLADLPRFLTSKGGLHSGLMMAQYTAASIVSENKVLCHPASVDSIPTGANLEDHNSMGSVAAQKLWKVLNNTWTVIGIEFLCACQALDFTRRRSKTRHPLRCGKGTEAAYRFVRKRIPHLEEDRVLFDDIEMSLKIVRDDKLLETVERTTGPLE
ncbi:MAG: histidine ammonia-lyase [Bacteroidota bacterium]